MQTTKTTTELREGGRAESATDELERAGGDDEAEDALETTPKAGENGDGDGKKKLGHPRTYRTSWRGSWRRRRSGGWVGDHDDAEDALEMSTKLRTCWRRR